MQKSTPNCGGQTRRDGREEAFRCPSASLASSWGTQMRVSSYSQSYSKAQGFRVSVHNSMPHAVSLQLRFLLSLPPFKAQAPPSQHQQGGRLAETHRTSLRVDGGDSSRRKTRERGRERGKEGEAEGVRERCGLRGPSPPVMCWEAAHTEHTFHRPPEGGEEPAAWNSTGGQSGGLFSLMSSRPNYHIDQWEGKRSRRQRAVPNLFQLEGCAWPSCCQFSVTRFQMFR